MPNQASEVSVWRMQTLSSLSTMHLRAATIFRHYLVPELDLTTSHIQRSQLSTGEPRAVGSSFGWTLVVVA